MYCSQIVLLRYPVFKKLCKLVKVSNKSSDFVHFSQSKQYLKLCLKSSTDRVTNVNNTANTQQKDFQNKSLIF